MPGPEPPARRRRLSLSLRLTVTVALSWWLISTISLREIGGAVAAASPLPVLLAWTLGLVDAFLSGTQLRVWTRGRGLRVGAARLFGIQLETQFYGLVLPGYLSGGAVRWAKLAGVERKPAEAAACILSNRLFETGMLVLVGLALWAADLPWAPRAFGAFFLVLAVAGLAGYLLIARTGWVGHARRWLDTPRGGRLREGLKRLFDAFSRGRSPSRLEKLALVACNLFRQSVGILGTWLLARAVGADVSLVTVGWVLAFVKLATLAPISISGFGVREGSLALALAPYGVSPAVAVGLSLLMFSRVLLQGFLGGLLETRHLVRSPRAGRIDMTAGSSSS